MNTSEPLLTNKDFALFARLAVAAVIAIVCAATNVPEKVMAGLCAAAVLIAALELFISVIKSIPKFKFFNEHFIMLIALIVTLLAGHYPEAVLAAMLFRISDFLCTKLRLHALEMAKYADCLPDTDKKSRMESFMESALHFYVPAVVLIALLLIFIPRILMEDASPVWLSRAAILLMVCTPCALTFSIPLGSLYAIYKMSHKGVALNSVSAVELLAATNTIVLDGPDVLASHKYIIDDVLPVKGLSSRNLLLLASYALVGAGHPAAPAVSAAFGGDIDRSYILDSGEVPGMGVMTYVKGLVLSAGNLSMMEMMGMGGAASALSAIHLAVSGKYAGCIVLHRKNNEGIKSAIEAMTNIGTHRIVLFSSDSASDTARSARELGINEYFSDLSLTGKERQLEILLAETFPEETLTYIGRAPSLLEKADTGIAVGESIEGCNAVLTTEKVGAVADAIVAAKRGRSIIIQGMVLAIVLKLALLVLTMLGIAPFWLAVLADSGVAILTVANAMRAGR